MYLELKNVFSLDLNKPETPDDPECCSVLMLVDVGEKGKKGADQFSFTVVTPKYLEKHAIVRWGRGYLLLPVFSWQEINRMLERLVSSINAETWEEAAKSLNIYLEWEFDNYQKNNA